MTQSSNNYLDFASLLGELRVLIYELLLDNVICHLNHFLTIFQGVHGGLCEHYFALFWVDVHLLLAKCVILQLFQ